MTDPTGCAGPAQLGGSSPGAVRWRVPARVCRARPPPYNLLLTVRGIVTLQFVRLRAIGMAPAGARRRAPEKNPGTRRRTAVRIVLGPSRSLRTSGRSTSRKRGNGSCDYTDRGRREHGLPSPQAWPPVIAHQTEGLTRLTPPPATRSEPTQQQQTLRRNTNT